MRLPGSVLTAALLLTATACQAAPDLVRCLYPNGIAIEPKVCELLRGIDERERAAEEENRRATAESLRRMDEQRARDAQADAARAVALQAARDAERDRAAQQAAQQADDDQAGEQRYQAQKAQRDRLAAQAMKEQDAAERRDAAFIAAKRKACGADYGAPRVGMTLDRARECVGTFRLVGQSTLPQGVASVYRSGWLLISVVDGTVRSFSRP